MFKKKLIEDGVGLVFSIDLMLALIIITVLLGVSANAMDIIGGKIQEYSYTNSLERITMAGTEMLIENAGSPENWEELNDLNGVIPGLADIDPVNMKVQPKTLSIRKIKRLKENYDELMVGKVLPPYYHSNLMICPVDQSIEPITMGQINTNSSSHDVLVVNRTISLDCFNSSVVVFIDAKKYNSSNRAQKVLGEECPHQDIGKLDHLRVDYEKNHPGWTCYHLKITREMLNSTDFYLITDPEVIGDPSAVWIIDRPENITEDVHSFNNKPTKVNDILSEFMGNQTATVLWLHVYSAGDPQKTFNTYLAGFPRATPIEMVKWQNLNPQPCYFVFKAWC